MNRSINFKQLFIINVKIIFFFYFLKTIDEDLPSKLLECNLNDNEEEEQSK